MPEDGNEITFYHNGGIAKGIVNGKADDTTVPVYMPDTDKQLYVLLENVLS